MVLGKMIPQPIYIQCSDKMRKKREKILFITWHCPVLTHSSINTQTINLKYYIKLYIFSDYYIIKN